MNKRSEIATSYALHQHRKQIRPYKFVSARVADIVMSPFTAAACFLMKGIRRAGVHRMPVSRALFERIGVFPIRNHYYEPLFKFDTASFGERELPGVDFHIADQLKLLESFSYKDELRQIPLDAPDEHCPFYYRNETYLVGDAEFLYCMVRRLKPNKVYEVGSGNSTLMVAHALRVNARENTQYSCDHVCIEPYEQPWLERAGVRVIRERAEKLGPQFFAALEADDILFIDSSHMIRPGGDVLFLYQRVLPSLQRGVYVHIHDIFSPREYPEQWLANEKRFWNEQYLLEAFLCMNTSFQVVAALNLLSQEHRDSLAAALPVYGQEADSFNPGAFWIQRVS